MLVLDVSIAIDCFCTLSYFLTLLLLLTGFETLLPFFPKLSFINALHWDKFYGVLRTSLGISFPGLLEASRTS